LFEEHGDAGELHKAEEVGGVILPADEQPPLPWQPGKEAFDEPAPFVPPETPAILGLQFPGGPMRGNQIHAILLAVVIEVEVETQLDEGDRMMIGGMCTYRERDPGDPQSPGFSPLCRVS
jgi:hypothetical protein